jgi:hypothetical protein
VRSCPEGFDERGRYDVVIVEGSLTSVKEVSGGWQLPASS